MAGKVAELEAQSDSLSAAELYKKVLPFSGMGPFTAANVLQLLGMHTALPSNKSLAQCLIDCAQSKVIWITEKQAAGEWGYCLWLRPECCCTGHFEQVAADSETLRHLKQFHKPPGLTPKNVQEVAQKVS